MKFYNYIFKALLCVLLVVGGSPAFAQVTITSSDSISCSVLCTTLRAALEGDTPTDAGITSDDIYSSAHAIGFTFNYYGVNYTQCVIGANGTLDFNLSDAGAGDPYSITGPLLGNPSKFNNICGPWVDIDIFSTGSPVGTETYSTSGVAPFRRFAVSWCGCSMYQCSLQHSTTQIILYETTNIIEVHVSLKPVCSWNGGYAIIGVQNATGTAATTAPGRDYPSVWTIPPTEAWRFTPTGGGTAYTVASIPYAPIPYASSLIYWYNATTGAYLGTGDSIVVCPTTTTTYKAGALGCADTSFGYYTVVPAHVLAITATFTNPTRCGSCDGSISIHGLTPGIVDTIYYNLGGVPQTPVIATVSPSGTITITGLCAGSYDNIIVHDASCASPPYGPVVLVNPPIAITGFSSINPTACGVADGSITLYGLYPGYLFTVNYTKDGVAQAPVSVTSSGTGSITITGLSGAAPPFAPTVYDNFVASFGACSTPPAGPVSLAAPAPPPAAVITTTNPTECGKCNGTISIRPIVPFTIDSVFFTVNGIPQPPFVVMATADSTVLVTGLCEGNYTAISVKIDECVHAVTGSPSLVAPPMVAAFSEVYHYGCNGDSVFYTNLSTSTGPLDYIWNFGDGTTDTAKDPKHVFAQGIYTVTLTVTNHFCTRTYSLQDSFYHPLTSVFRADQNIVCQGTAINFTNKSDSLSSLPLSYLWKFGDGKTSNVVNPSHVYPIAGQYNVQLIASNFVPCFDTASLTVFSDSLSPVSINITDSVLCRSTYVTFTGDYTSIGNTGVTWNFGDGDTLQNRNPVSHSFDRFGTDTVMLTAHFRVCRDTFATRVINIFAQPTVYLGADTTICAGSTSLTLSDGYNATNKAARWKWSTGQTTPSIVVTAPGDYSVTTTINGCSTTDDILVINDCYINIPNIFTPNHDGLNDYFFPRQYLTKGLTTFKMDIYNRWGQLIFETNTIDGSGWDGKLNNVDQPEGVYIFVIDATFKDGQKEHHQGNVTLVR